MKEKSGSKTVLAKYKVENIVNSAQEAVNSYYGDGDDRHRTEKWKKEINTILKEKNMTKEDLERYLYPYKKESTSILVSKCPKKREIYIGIGLCLKQPEEVINRWINDYAGKQSLYIKDCFTGDLAWKYLIRVAQNDAESDTNYYVKHEEICEVILKEYARLRENNIVSEIHDNMTHIISEEFNEIINSSYNNLDDLKSFVKKYYNSFETAYQKGREYLIKRAKVLMMLLDKYYNDKHFIKNENIVFGKPFNVDQPWNYLFTYEIINQSMRNYLSAESNFSSLSKLKQHRKAHIKMCLSLGLTKDEIDEYLKMMGYEPLSAVLDEEYLLIFYMKKWEKQNDKVLYLRWKFGLIKSISDKIVNKYNDGLNPQIMINTICNNIYMRNFIKEMYESDNMEFPYTIHNNTKTKNYDSEELSFYK